MKKTIVSTIPNLTIVSCGFEASHHFKGRSENSPSFWAPFDQKTGTKNEDDFILCQSREQFWRSKRWHLGSKCVQHRIFGGCWLKKQPFHFLALWLDKKWQFYSHPWNYGNYWLFPLQHITQSYLVTKFWVISSPHSCGRSLRLYACRARNLCFILFYGYLMLT